MRISDYYEENDSKIRFTRQNSSAFAKEVAGDFNPIHDADAKRFCVPGDLLFALVLDKFGLSQRMRFQFSGMVTDDVVLNLPEAEGHCLVIGDDNGKEYLSVERDGDTSFDPALIRDLIRDYVEFSGQTFPHILVPLMAKHQVMINPARPLVIYESMVIDIDRLDIESPSLELTESLLDTDGKRGSVCLKFHLVAGGEVIGRGEKNMVLSGLRPYDQSQIDALATWYGGRKEEYLGACA